MPIHVLCIGAHPDDCEGSIGGTALLFRRRGDRVTFVSVTDGSRGHFHPDYLQNPVSLVERRLVESRRATQPYGIEFQTLGIPDGDVYVDKESTESMIRLIRLADPDLVITNRPNDYHRDHRYTAQLVLDASYMLTVPFLCPDAPALKGMPVIAYWQDRFTEGGEFRPDVVIDIADVAETKAEMMLAHESQYLEWLPFNANPDGYAPPSREEVKDSMLRRFANPFMEGPAEAFQISEYGRRPSEGELAALFP